MCTSSGIRCEYVLPSGRGIPAFGRTSAGAAFGLPVDTLAASCLWASYIMGAVVADFMADHVFDRLDIPG